ncbi:MAG TPA: hypothetical protein VKE98_06565 [Gemmataceae bacterium]|nr:hypothetical protein [Gemmataceae bacterium]
MKGLIKKMVAAALCLGCGLFTQAASAQSGGGGCSTCSASSYASSDGGCSSCGGCNSGCCGRCGIGGGCGIGSRLGLNDDGICPRCVDPCWPERYNFMAARSVITATNAQAYNGHVLDQTVWNHMFEVDPKSGKATDRLNAYGLSHLSYLARRRPNPDPHIYLQTAQDIPYNQADGAKKFVLARTDLDMRRVRAIQEFLQAQTATRHLGYDFEVTVHDPAEVGIAAIPIGGNQPATLYRVFGSVPQLQGNFRGILPGGAGAGFGSTGGGGGGTGTGGGTGGGGGAQPGGAGSPGTSGGGSTSY